MTTIRFDESDRDRHGFIRLSPPDDAPDAAPDESPPPPAPPPRTARPAAPARTARPPLSPRLRYQLTMALSGVAGLLLILLTMRLSSPRAIAPAVPTAAPVALALPAPTAPPVAMLPAYGAPDGVRLGEIEATRLITPVAHLGADWIFATVQGSGTIWLRASDFPQLAIIGKDLAQPTPLPYVAPTPAPQPPCASAGVGNQRVTVCEWLTDGELTAAAAAKWAAKYGGNVGSGDIRPTAQPWDTIPPNSPISERQKLIGRDPAALACQNDDGKASPLCGGLTNAAAQAALDKEKRP